MPKFLRVVSFLALMTALGAASAWATDYYVDPAGSDANDGLTPATAKLTIQAAIGVASATDVINIADGTYNEAVVVDKSLTLDGASELGTILDGTGLGSPVRGITVNTGITNVAIKDLTVRNYLANSPNSYAGVYATGPGNDGLVVRNVTIKDNVGGSGFYANGPVNGVTLDNLDVSGHTNVAGAARGIVIWNGLKQNITITNSDVYNNNCCGIELQDGTASGVTMTGNNIHDNGDNGIGIVGLEGPGENLVSGNTVTNNGRFGIEVKNPNGSGSDTGPGRVVVENNTVTRTLAIVDARDLVGIAAFRRGVLAGNVDVPNGAVIRNNIVSGYVQPSNSDGFGIVAEGTNHSVTGNDVSGCDVGIQRQKGHLPYPGDGDQSNLADQYFGRGNSPVACGITVSGNTLANTVDTRDVPVALNSGVVTNTTTLETFCSIQSAIDDANTAAGHTLEVGSGTFDEQVLVNKGVTIKGVGAPLPVVDYTGVVSGKPTLFDVSVDGVTVETMRFDVDLAKLRSAIIASGASIDQITITDNGFHAYGTAAGSFGDRNAVSVNYGGPTNYRNASGGVDEIVYTGNTVSGTPSPVSFFRAGIAADEAGGTFDGNTSQAISHDVLVRFGSNGDVGIRNNTFNGGGVELAEMNAGAGILTVENNDFDGTFNQVASPNSALLRLKNNQQSKPTNVHQNTFVNSPWSVSLENYNSVEVARNEFTPPASSTTYHHVTVNTKSISTNSAAIVPTQVDADIFQNFFRGSGTTGGSGVTFLYHDTTGSTFGPMNVNQNSFDLDVANAIEQDGQSGNTTGATFPNYNALIGGGIGAQTTMAPWTEPIAGTCNWYGTTVPAAVASRVGPDVVYDPYLFSGVDDQPGTPGFQPEAGACQSPDLVCPSVTLLSPNGGPPAEIFVVGASAKIGWNATDNVGVTAIDILLSRDNGVTFPETIATGIANSGSFIWVVTGPASNTDATPVYEARVRIVAHDAFGNACSDDSDNPFSIYDITTSTLVSSFVALPVVDGVRLRWSFGHPEMMSAVRIERGLGSDGPWTAVGNAIEAGRTSEFLDREVESGRTYSYRLVGSVSGSGTMVLGQVSVTAGIAIDAFELSSVAPNPTSGPTTIDFALPRSSHLRLAVLDIQGREVALLANATFEPGRHQVTWSGRTERGPAVAGVYFVRYEAGGKVVTRRLALTR